MLHFFAVFLDFQIFQIFDDFETTSLSNSTPWLDFLPGAASKSTGHEILSLFKFSCSYGVHVPFSGYQMLAEKNFPRHGVAFSRSAMTVRP